MLHFHLESPYACCPHHPDEAEAAYLACDHVLNGEPVAHTEAPKLGDDGEFAELGEIFCARTHHNAVTECRLVCRLCGEELLNHLRISAM